MFILEGIQINFPGGDEEAYIIPMIYIKTYFKSMEYWERSLNRFQTRRTSSETASTSVPCRIHVKVISKDKEEPSEKSKYMTQIGNTILVITN